MTSEIIFILSVLGIAILLFASEKLRVDIIALLVLLSLVLSGQINYQEAFSGFSNPAVITVWAVYIVSAGLNRTGVASLIGKQLEELGGKNEPRTIAVIMLICGILSAFMNNIGATAILMPAVAGLSRTSRIPLSRLLIPLSFSSLLGGNMTLIGTPPNILANQIMAEHGLKTFEFFDFTPMGLVVLSTGILYMMFAGRHLLPQRKTAQEKQTARLREFVSEVHIKPGSSLAGKTLLDSRLGVEYDLNVISIIRNNNMRTALSPEQRLMEGDLLVVQGAIQDLLDARNVLGLSIEAEKNKGLSRLESEQSHLIEATLAPHASIAGCRIGELHFRERFGVIILAIGRKGEVITSRLKDVRLEFGDTLLLQGPKHNFDLLQEGDDFLLLESARFEASRSTKLPFSLTILASVILLVTLFNFHISIAMLMGALLMILTGCLTMDEAYHSIEWRSVFLIAGMLPLGLAMETSGTARFLADNIINLLGNIGPYAVLAGIYLLSGLITEPMSNAAATVLMVPISIDVALSLGANPQTFVLATVIGASTSFLTPIGHQANVLVYGPGGYRFFDYTRVGGPLNLLLLVAVMLFLPIFFPLY